MTIKIGCAYFYTTNSGSCCTRRYAIFDTSYSICRNSCSRRFKAVGANADFEMEKRRHCRCSKEGARILSDAVRQNDRRQFRRIDRILRFNGALREYHSSCDGLMSSDSVIRFDALAAIKRGIDQPLRKAAWLLQVSQRRRFDRLIERMYCWPEHKAAIFRIAMRMQEHSWHYCRVRNKRRRPNDIAAADLKPRQPTPKANEYVLAAKMAIAKLGGKAEGSRTGLRKLFKLADRRLMQLRASESCP